jgi:hypothetical protein
MSYGYAWHVHHDQLMEELTEPIEQRIKYIKTHKPKNEIVLRLKLLKASPKLKPLDDDYKAKWKPLYDDYKAKRKPLDDDYKAKWKPLYDDYKAKWKPLYDDYEAKRKPLDDDYKAKLAKLHHEECVPDCPWNGSTIFP